MSKKKVTLVMENTKFDKLRYEVTYGGRESQLDKLIEVMKSIILTTV